MSNIKFTNHLRYPEPDFMKSQAPLIAASANATEDELSELALMGLHIKAGSQLVVRREHIENFLRWKPAIPFKELSWPSPTVELFLDHALLPTILGGVLSSDDIKAMGFKYWKAKHGKCLHTLIQERDKEVTLQAYYEPEFMEELINTHPNDIPGRVAADGEDPKETVMLALSATFMYRAIDLFNLGAFESSTTKIPYQPWRDVARNRPITDCYMLTTTEPEIPKEDACEETAQVEG